MIHLIPFYMSLNSKIHQEERNHESDTFNRKFSASLLQSLLPALYQFLTETEAESIVIITPSSNESQVITSYLIKQTNANPDCDMLGKLHLADLRPVRIVDTPGIYIMAFPNAKANLISCDCVVNYYPVTLDILRDLYRRTRALALFDPVNKQDNWYSTYIQHVLARSSGVRK